MKSLVTLFASLLLLLSSEARAESADLSYQLYGQGDVDCSQAFKSRDSVIASQSWTQGYLSGQAFIKGLSFHVSEQQHAELLDQLPVLCPKGKWLIDAMPAVLKAPQLGAASSEYSSVLGAGAFSCSDYLRHAHDKRTGALARIIYGSWMEGYVSAAALGLGNWSLSEIVQNDMVLTFLNNYCQQYPQTTVVHSGIELIRYLSPTDTPHLQAAETSPPAVEAKP
ncbi:hypothetical protein C4K68_27030 [Pokkaliibacter plantistimulans]|uniref:Rap1a immunity protein domain-containing protein n=1 Tax=Proteobacteria bacterium 228 TaxID=2083153 RepID=A0A2S5KI80_9PROT|nr:hypothetical protein [Pokkaliibacter plantistimulans]PPC74076.1 hypothetical protein C4K68_27030 [Pokkaliibacter plantistimulans]